MVGSDRMRQAFHAEIYVTESKLVARVRWIGTKLHPYATVATYILAVVGLFSLSTPLLNLILRPLTPTDISGSARPICEVYPFPMEGITSPGNLKLMGAHIHAIETISDLRLSMDGIQEVKSWGMLSSGLSRPEQDEFLSRLQTGPTVAPIVTPEFPKLLADTDTVLSAIVVPLKGSCANGRWLSTHLPTGKVYVTDPSEQTLRDFDYMVDLGTGWGVVIAVLVIGVVLITLKYRRTIFTSWIKRSTLRSP